MENQETISRSGINSEELPWKGFDVHKVPGVVPSSPAGDHIDISIAYPDIFHNDFSRALLNLPHSVSKTITVMLYMMPKSAGMAG